MSGNAKKRRGLKELKDLFSKEEFVSYLNKTLIEIKKNIKELRGCAMASLVSVDALIRVLVDKGIISMEELDRARFKGMQDLNANVRKQQNIEATNGKDD